MAEGLNAQPVAAEFPAHANEEQTREKPMRRIHPTDHEYDGPEDRSL